LKEFILLAYLKISDDAVAVVTLWIIADFDAPSGRKLLFNALKHMVSKYSSYKQFVAFLRKQCNEHALNLFFSSMLTL
jgi:UDP-glucose:glycoprotein glucosyltransferase